MKQRRDIKSDGSFIHHEDDVEDNKNIEKDEQISGDKQHLGNESDIADYETFVNNDQID